MISNNGPKSFADIFCNARARSVIVSVAQSTCLVRGVIYKHRFRSHTQKCLSLDMEHRLCFPFCQGHYGRMQSHRQEIQFEMSYNLRSTINHTPLNSTLPLFPTHTHTAAAIRVHELARRWTCAHKRQLQSDMDTRSSIVRAYV